MKYSLNRLIIKSRIGNRLYLITALFFIILIFELYYLIDFDFVLPNFFKYIYLSILFPILLVIMILSKFYTTSSDYNFLFNIPLNKNKILKAYYIMNVLSTLYFFIVISMLIFFSMSSYMIILGVFDIFLLYLTSINISFLSKYFFKNKFIVLLFFIYLTSPLIYNYKFNPVSIFLGNILYGNISLLILFLATVYFMKKYSYKMDIYDLNIKKYPEMESIKITGNSVSVIYKLNLLLSNNSFLFGFARKKLRIQRHKIYVSLSFFTIIAIIFFTANYIFIAYIKMITPYNGKLYSYGELDYYLIFYLMYYILYKNSFAIGNERLWLFSMSMNFNNYIRNLTLAKSLSTFLNILPISIAYVIIYIFSGNYFILLLTLYILINSFIMPVQLLLSGAVSAHQINDPENVQIYFSLNDVKNTKFFVLMLPLGFILSILSFFIFTFFYLLIIYYIMDIIGTLNLLYNKKFYDKIYNYMSLNFI